MKIRAFSLIELMVVIAIIAILAAVAVPAYKTYMARSKLSVVMSGLETLKQMSIRYYVSKGKFPNASELGIDSGATNPPLIQVISTAFTDPSVIATVEGDVSTSTCPHQGSVTAYLSDNTYYVFNGVPINYMGYNMFDLGDEIKSFCTYQPATATTADAGISGCLNANDPAVMTTYSNLQLQAMNSC